MELFYRKIGEEGRPLIILHGLFGSGDNWQTLARSYAEDHQVYLVDQRNHGRSPHADEFSYELMADDLAKFVEDHDLTDVDMIGHSMGGKTAMLFASEHSYALNKLIVADMAPKPYPLHHQKILEALMTADLNSLGTRGAVGKHLEQHIEEEGVRQFLLKNLYWKNKGELAWRFNVPVLNREIGVIVDETDQQICLTDTLFVRGSESNYITDEDQFYLSHYFPNSELETINGAGHWLHAEAPETFLAVTRTFLEAL
ncbi:alpha/beta fold hydrolase [Sanyastnella coralliicola]|uniref:alpha/beta fold hydrolase n=1 Tax=Sanyastnella coralliicola TaxID=3069118 RepID=UPI0027BA9247|nr:alpha/beta fold hydrolase [Longitalea sp. SCSIO 12813]